MVTKADLEKVRDGVYEIASSKEKGMRVSARVYMDDDDR